MPTSPRSQHRDAQAVANRGDLSTHVSLIVRLCGQDEPAWGAFTRLYAPLVVRWCDRRRLPEADIADVAQEVFLKVSRGIHDFRKESATDSFRGWLCRITHHEIANHYRRQKGAVAARGGTEAHVELQELTEPRGSGPTAAEPAAGEARQEIAYLYQQAVQLVRSEFSDAAWQMFWRVTVDGNTATAVAEEFATTSAAVRQNKSRILRRLKQVVGDLPE